MRGIKHAVDSVIDDLSKIMLPMWMKVSTPLNPGAEVSGTGILNPEGQINMVQVAVRPVQAFEIVFPKEYEDLMCATLFHKPRGQTNEKWLKPYFWLLRKVLRLKPINWDYRELPAIPLKGKEFVEIIGIGKKDDNQIKDEKTDYEGL